MSVKCRTALLDSESDLDRQLAPVTLTPEDNRQVGDGHCILFLDLVRADDWSSFLYFSSRLKSIKLNHNTKVGQPSSVSVYLVFILINYNFESNDKLDLSSHAFNANSRVGYIIWDRLGQIGYPWKWNVLEMNTNSTIMSDRLSYEKLGIILKV